MLLSNHDAFKGSKMKLLITGATGFIGSELLKMARSQGHEIYAVYHTKPSQKNLTLATYWLSWSRLLDEGLPACEGVIHLAGAPIMGKIWSETYKKKLVASRINTTRTICNLICQSVQPPKVFIGASAVGYYPISGGPYDESSEPGTGFLSELCKAWELQSEHLEAESVRRVIIRSGIVLGNGKGAWPKMRFPISLGLGGPVGDGQQIVPWIHLEDMLRMIFEALINEQIKGPVNAVAPEITTQAQFSQTVASLLHRPCFIKTPSWLVKAALGEASTLVLQGAPIVGKVAHAIGFKFKYPTLRSAVQILECERQTLRSTAMTIWAKWLYKMGPMGRSLLKKSCSALRRPLVEVKFNCGYGNSLYIRGELPLLTWSQGIEMTNLDEDSWIWIAPTTFKGDFKILINDKFYEEGPNHTLDGLYISVCPLFNLFLEGDKA